ncbi:MAG: SDR family NAD(P)-dependent oxidoreductase [Candidatus Micrarchaeaceae archaeon]|jgi:short-subunit dehydrogenase
MVDSKVVLVTGASSGFGKSTATLLSQSGYAVFGTSRKPNAKGNGFQMLQLDIDSDKSVNACISELIKKTGRIDVLVNNAGYIITGAIEETTIEDAKSQFETNFFGVCRMVNAALPIMRKQKSGQIINVGSLAGTFPVPFQGMYAATKAALLAYSEALLNEVKSLNINVSLIEPGYFNTGIMDDVMTSSKNISEYNQAKKTVLSKLRKEIENGGNPEMIAETVLKLIKSKSPRFRNAVGKEKNFLIAKRLVPDSAFESLVRNHWKLD